jgi:Fe2+ or Zn2+ uptake regulation protein
VRSPDQLVEHFRARGLKVTPQRELLFRLVHADGGHPTAETVYREARRVMPTMSLKTVYQTLNDLTAMGELQQLDLGTGATRFDPNGGDHHHLVCTSCGEVRDVSATFDGLGLPPEQRHGYALSGAEIVFRGLCTTCQRTPPGQNDPPGPGTAHAGPPAAAAG